MNFFASLKVLLIKKVLSEEKLKQNSLALQKMNTDEITKEISAHTEEYGNCKHEIGCSLVLMHIRKNRNS